MANGDKRGFQDVIAAIRCGIGGLMANLNPSMVSIRNVIQAEGCVFRQDHWRKEPGSFLFGTNIIPVVDPADRVIVALNDWHPTETVQRIVHLLGNGHLYFTIANPGIANNPDAFESTTTSGVGTRFGYFVTGGSDAAAPTTRKLFLFRSNFGLTVVKGDVTNDVPIAAPATDWVTPGPNSFPPIVGVINGPRLFAAGNTNDPHRLYYSKDGDQEDFTTNTGSSTDPGTLSIFPGVGERIMGLCNYRGFVVVLKYPRGVFLVDARDADPVNWLIEQVAESIGIAPSPYCPLQLENDVIFMGSDGQFYMLSAVVGAAAAQNNLAVANLGMNLEIYQFLLEAYQRDMLGSVASVYQPFWQTATFAVTAPGSEQNNTRLVFDFTALGRGGGAPRFTYSYRDKCASLALWRDPNDFILKPIFGDYVGDIVELEQEARTAWDGAAYPFRVQTPHSNLGELENLDESIGKFVQFANRNKIWENIEVEYLPFTAATVQLTVFVDGVKRAQGTMTNQQAAPTGNGGTVAIALCDGGKPLGFADDDAAAFVIGDSLLAGGVVRSVVRRLVGEGRRISLLFENEIAGEDVAITHVYLGFQVGNTTAQRGC